MSDGPNARAGLKPPPLTGPNTNSARPSVAPIAKPAQSFVPRGLTATPTIAQTRKNVPISSAANATLADAARRRRRRRGAEGPGGLAAFSLSNISLQTNAGGDAADELDEDVDRGVDRPDLAEHRHRRRDGRVEVGARDDRERLDQREQRERVHEADHRPVLERLDRGSPGVAAGSGGGAYSTTATQMKKTSPNVPMNSAR